MDSSYPIPYFCTCCSSIFCCVLIQLNLSVWPPPISDNLSKTPQFYQTKPCHLEPLMKWPALLSNRDHISVDSFLIFHCFDLLNATICIYCMHAQPNSEFLRYIQWQHGLAHIIPNKLFTINSLSCFYSIPCGMTLVSTKTTIYTFWVVVSTGSST